jgi:hypothetical protein
LKLDVVGVFQPTNLSKSVAFLTSACGCHTADGSVVTVLADERYVLGLPSPLVARTLVSQIAFSTPATFGDSRYANFVTSAAEAAAVCVLRHADMITAKYW